MNQWFFDNVSQGSVEQTVGAVDWERECIVWSKHFDFDEQDQAKLIKWIVAQVQEGAGDAIRKWNPSDTKLQGIALNAVAVAMERRLGIDLPGIGADPK